MPFLLDTSVLIASEEGPDDEVAISVVSLTTLAEPSVGPLTAESKAVAAERQAHLQLTEADFTPLPFDAAAARAFGRVAPRCDARARRQPRAPMTR